MSPDNTQMDPLGEQTRLINMALKYTQGNLDKARLMAAGQLDDVVIIKGKYSAGNPDFYGALVVFLNIESHYIMNINTLTLPESGKIDRMRIFDGWKTFYGELMRLIGEEGMRDKAVYEFSNHLADSMVGYDIYDDLENADIEGVTQVLSEIIGKFHGNNKVKCQIEMEKTSSLSMELEGIPTEAFSGNEMPSGDDLLETPEDKKMREIEEEAKYVIQGKLIVSPVRGKYINDIKPGENIKVQLVSQDEISKKVAKVLNAYTEEGEFLPIKGRVKEKISLGKSGYIIYSLVAKNVLAKIIEEENVKIEMDSPGTAEKTDKKDTRLVLYVTLLLGLVMLTLIVLFAML